MPTIKHNLTIQQKRALRVHKKVVATSDRPKLLITRSNKFIYLQIIDAQGHILASVSDAALIKAKKIKASATKTERAAQAGQVLADALKAKKITALAVDRGACKFHGRIKAAVEVIRENGVEA